MGKTDKITRILILYYKLIKGEYINKKVFSNQHLINERSFDRDIEDIRLFLSEVYSTSELVFDRTSNSYYLTGYHNTEITGVELMALLKILMSSRAFVKDEMEGILAGIMGLVSRQNQKQLIDAVKNELENYKSPTHNKAILKLQWDLNKCILNQRKIIIKYHKQNNEKVERKVSPLSVVFSESYYYLVAFIDDKNYDFPAFFRVDRIDSFIVLDELYSKNLYDLYNVGEMKKCINFMYAGDLINIKLKCRNAAVEAVLDRIPSSEVAEENHEYSIINAEIFGQGFLRWVMTQGDMIEVLEPKELRQKIYEQALEIIDLYKEGLKNGKKD